MRDMSQLQRKVVDAAKAEIQNRSWYKCVCIDNIPTDEEITQNFNAAVDSLIFETAMWDDPNFLSAIY